LQLEIAGGCCRHHRRLRVQGDGHRQQAESVDADPSVHEGGSGDSDGCQHNEPETDGEWSEATSWDDVVAWTESQPRHQAHWLARSSDLKIPTRLTYVRIYETTDYSGYRQTWALASNGRVYEAWPERSLLRSGHKPTADNKELAVRTLVQARAGSAGGAPGGPSGAGLVDAAQRVVTDARDQGLRRAVVSAAQRAKQRTIEFVQDPSQVDQAMRMVSELWTAGLTSADVIGRNGKVSRIKVVRKGLTAPTTLRRMAGGFGSEAARRNRRSCRRPAEGIERQPDGT